MFLQPLASRFYACVLAVSSRSRGRQTEITAITASGRLMTQEGAFAHCDGSVTKTGEEIPTAPYYVQYASVSSCPRKHDVAGNAFWGYT